MPSIVLGTRSFNGVRHRPLLRQHLRERQKTKWRQEGAKRNQNVRPSGPSVVRPVRPFVQRPCPCVKGECVVRPRKIAPAIFRNYHMCSFMSSRSKFILSAPPTRANELTVSRVSSTRGAIDFWQARHYVFLIVKAFLNAF